MDLSIINVLRIHFILNPENDVSYLALKSTRTIDTITCLNISKNS